MGSKPYFGRLADPHRPPLQSKTPRKGPKFLSEQKNASLWFKCTIVLRQSPKCDSHYRMANVFKGRLAALFVGALFVLPAPREALAGSDWTIFGNVGGNASWASVEPRGPRDGGPRFGLGFGGGLERRLSREISISGGVRYSQKGVNTELLSFGRLNVTGQLILDYIEIPLHLRWQYQRRGWDPFVFGGISYGISKNRELRVDQFSFINVDVDSRFDSPDIVLDVGAGAETRLGPGLSLRVWVQYGHGLQDLDRNIQTSYHSRTLTLGVGLAHRL